jgi:hypothetical protein
MQVEFGESQPWTLATDYIITFISIKVSVGSMMKKLKHWVSW